MNKTEFRQLMETILDDVIKKGDMKIEQHISFKKLGFSEEGLTVQLDTGEVFHMAIRGPGKPEVLSLTILSQKSDKKRHFSSNSPF